MAGVTGQDCARALTEKNLFMYSRSTSERLAWMETIDEQQFERMKADGSLAIPDLLGITWSQFSDKRSELRKTLSINYSFDESVSLLHWYGSADATEKWLECIKLASEASLFEVIPQPGEDDEHVVLHLHWRPAPEIAGTEIKLDWDIRGGTAKFPKQMPPGENRVIIDRKKSEEIVGVVNASIKKYARAASFRVPVEPPVVKPLGSVVISERVRSIASPDGPIQDAHTLSVFVDGPADWTGVALSFFQSGFFEQAVVIWEGDTKVVRWGTNPWHQENLGGRLLPGRAYVLAAWNKPPGGSWRTSTLRVSAGNKEFAVGIDDAPVGAGDGDFDDAIVRLMY